MKSSKKNKLILAAVLIFNIVLLGMVVSYFNSSNSVPEEDITLPLVKLEKGWKKVKTFDVGDKTAHAIATDENGQMAIGGDNGVTLFDNTGKKLAAYDIKGGITALSIDGKTVYAALQRQIVVIKDGKIRKWPEFDSRTSITSLVVDAGKLFIADAGNRKLLCFDLSGRTLWETTGGKDEKFIIPSPYFDLAPDGYGGVWAVNPGRHRIENYAGDGRFKASWTSQPANVFSGCCNPAYFVMLDGDRFVTLEKGTVRARLFSPSGKMLETVVPESGFPPGPFRYDLAVMPGGKIAILNGAKGLVDVYEPNIKPEVKK